MIPTKKILTNFSFVSKMSQIVKRQTERTKRVHQNIETHNYSAFNQQKLRKKLSMQTYIQQLQKQMNQQIAKSLKNSQSKVVYLIKKAQEKSLQLSNKIKNAQQIQQYNDLITKCEKARWQFMIHRHAVGFTIKNYQMVMSLYKIPSRISLNQ